jgi:SAM-dependent methyltransferase
MKTNEFAKMRALQNTHWWFASRRYLLRLLIQKLSLREALILDAGCGTGFAHDELQKAGTVVSLDSSLEAFSEHCILKCVSRIEETPFRDNTFDLIVALDLLEHLEDDHKALVEIRRICKTGGYVFLVVPAYQWAWSCHDDFLGHRRRYSAKELVEVVQRAGLAVCKSTYFVSALLLPALVYRLVYRRICKTAQKSDLFPIPTPLNSLFRFCTNVEAKLALSVGLPFGLSVCVLAQKQH